MKQNKSIYILCICAICLTIGISSCKVGRSYTKPTMELPDSLWAKQSYLSIADLKWWEMFSDKTLRELVEQTLENNKDLQIAAAKVREMAAQKRIKNADFFPQINGLVDGEREFENYSGHDKDYTNTFDAKFYVSWEIDLWGKLRWGKTAAVAEYLQSIEAQHSLRMSLIAEVVQAYYELIALDNELAIVKQTLNAREEGVRIARLRYQGGLTSENPYQQAQLEVARTSTLVPDLERKIAQKENQIAFYAGRFPQKIERSNLLNEFNYATMLPVGLVSDLMERRPDIRQAEQQLIAAHAKVGVAYTSMFPSLTLTGQFGLESNELSYFLESPYMLLKGALVGPIFSAGKNRANWRAKQAAYDQAYYNYEKVVLNSFREVQNAIVAYNKIREMCESQAKLEKAAKNFVNLAQVQYLNGAVNYLDVLDAQRGSFDAQIALSNAIRDELISVVHLYKSLGGGW